MNIAFPSLFTIGGPPTWLGVLSVLVLLVGVVNWAWCVYLLLIKVPRRELITNGPYAVVKHPLYTGAALLVLPWLGFLLNTWSRRDHDEPAIKAKAVHTSFGCARAW